RGAIKLDEPLGRYLREFRGRRFEAVTIRRILTHSAGFAAVPPNRAVAPRFPEAAWALARVPLEYPPGTGFQYSDTGFILLGEVVRRVTGERLDRYLEHVFFRPLDLGDTSFRPRDAVKSRVAPTDYANGHLLQGEANDGRARLLGGVAGHAGMFSTAADLARLCRMLLNGGTLDGQQYLKPETVALMWEPNPEGQATRTLGWDLSSPFSRTLGPFFPMGSVGHTGFTGTAVWLDPASRTYMIVLTNRVHPNGGGAEDIRELRLRIAGAVGAALFAGEPPQPAMTGADAPAADLPARTRAHRARRRRLPELRDVHGPVGRPRDQPDGSGRPGAARDRPLRRGAGRASAGDLLARARDRRRGDHQRPERPRPLDEAADLEPLRLDAPADARDAEGREHARVRHAGRRRAPLHLPHDARLRDGRGGAGGDSPRRARPPEPDHGLRRRGTANG